MKFIEFSTGNTWLVRTETKLVDVAEYEDEGNIGPIQFQSAYIRIWIWKTVLILDLKEGIKLKMKNVNEFKGF